MRKDKKLRSLLKTSSGFGNKFANSPVPHSPGIYYFHYKASTNFKLSSEIYVQQLTIIVHSGLYSERWNVSLQVLLEKMAGVCLVEKLRYIQLYEVNFNFFRQFIFEREAMNFLTDNRFLPEEHFSKKGSTAEDAKFDKILTEHLPRQARHPMVVVSVDAAQCYDRLNHVIVA